MSKIVQLTCGNRPFGKISELYSFYTTVQSIFMIFQKWFDICVQCLNARPGIILQNLFSSWSHQHKKKIPIFHILYGIGWKPSLRGKTNTIFVCYVSYYVSSKSRINIRSCRSSYKFCLIFILQFFQMPNKCVINLYNVH